MKTPKPPFIAAWLLDRLGADPRMEAIAGDLLEQYRLGRSRFWYWREVITAIVAGMWCGFSGHKLLIVQALAAAPTKEQRSRDPEGSDPAMAADGRSYRRVSVNIISDMATPALTVTARPRVS